MLVLSRKTREQIKIGENITVTIVRVKGKTVRVGIEAPETVRVIRAELESSTADRETGPIQASAERAVGPRREKSQQEASTQAGDEAGEPLVAPWLRNRRSREAVTSQRGSPLDRHLKSRRASPLAI